MDNVSDKELVEFFQKKKSRVYKKGQVILHPDEETSNYIYYLEKGHVKVYSITEDGYEKCHIFYKPGEIFPLLPFL